MQTALKIPENRADKIELLHLLKEKFKVYESGNLDIPLEIPFSSIVERLTPEDMVVLEVKEVVTENFITVMKTIKEDFLSCPKCQIGTMQQIEIINPDFVYKYRRYSINST